MSEPSSFCTIATYTCYFEFIGLVYSLSIHHPNAKLYCFLDSKTKEVLERLSVKPKLDIIVKVELDKYTGLNRQMMERMNIIKEFWNNKANVMSYALQYENDTIFLDSDIFIINPIKCIDLSNDVGLSPHFTKKANTDEVGYYNGGCVWTKNKEIPISWKKYTITSRYVDQASLEDVSNDYRESIFEFGKEVNFMPWRVIVGDDPQQVVKSISIKNDNIYIEDKPLVFLHTHFHDSRFTQINNIFIRALKQLKRYKELLIIDRNISKSWIIKIPKQPRMGIWNHKNDSFRELALLYHKNVSDCKVQTIDSGHCWLGNNIVLYDRPTHEWFNNELMSSSMILLGNGDIKKEGNVLQTNKLNVKPWIFWPRRPILMETFLQKNPRKLYHERTCDSIFIGNIENSVQNRFRNTEHNWKDVLSEYHCTNGTKHKFTQNEYLEKMSNARYGLCLRGYGSKCHREVELMALGIVPIITPNVTITSYMNPPKENEHYIKIDYPDELHGKISKIDESKWNEMSLKCAEWYQQNVHSNNSFCIFISRLLYDET